MIKVQMIFYIIAYGPLPLIFSKLFPLAIRPASQIIFFVCTIISKFVFGIKSIYQYVRTKHDYCKIHKTVHFGGVCATHDQLTISISVFCIQCIDIFAVYISERLERVSLFYLLHLK